ncbi:MAG: hypothetical protein KGI06_02310 [Candidatus Micrarchaeota archaeon]|nr:hypothetical protein [Candidatus Micrarchaeota archaeon]
MTFKRISVVISCVVAALLLAGINAQTLNSYLATYIPNATISGASYFNQQANGNNYVVMQLSGASNRYVVISNASGTYSLVTDNSTIQSVLTPFLVNRYYPSASALAILKSEMTASESYSQANLSTCLVETGLNSQNTCTLANSCFSCQTVPVCKKVLNSIGGPYTPFGFGVMNFESNYTRLNSSYNSYFALLNSVNSTNAGTVISELSAITANITKISQVMDQNPIFPPPSGSSFSTCPTGGNPLNAPWYCVAVGFCAVIPFNSTALGNVRTDLSNIEASLPSTMGIQRISANSSAIAQNYINAKLQATNGAAFSSMISNFTPRFNSIINSSDKLLLEYNNETLNQSILVLKNQFAIVQNAGINQNISTANRTLQSYLSNTVATFNRANSSYNRIYGIAENNSDALLAAQLDYQQVPTKLAALASEQQGINAQIDSGIGSNDVSRIMPELQTIRIESALYVAPLTIGYMLKVADGPFISAILGPSGATVPEKIATAPLYAAVESFIIGALVILVIFVITYLRVIRKGKLKGSRSKKIAWIAVFAVLIALLLALTYSTYAYAQNANSFLPFGYFMNNLKASGNAYIALNGSAATNTSIIACADTIKGYLNGTGKTVQIVKLTNYSCVSGSNISSLGINCYRVLLDSGKPIIFISQSQSSNITYKGLYGTVLYASGNIAVGSSCTLGKLFKNV